MPKFFKIFTTLRNHWKKTTFFSGALAYAINYGKDQYEIDLFMTKLSHEAASFGDEKYINDNSMKHVCVILNPAANRRSARKNFDKYCSPLLNLSGSFITVLESEHEGDARKLVNKIDPKTNILVIAGGDGTISETITGLMRTHGDMKKIPVGLIPLGRFNTLMTSLAPDEKELPDPMKIANATMAVIRGDTKNIDAYKVQPIGDGNEKSVYGVGWFEWGGWPALKKNLKDKWFLGSLGKYYTLLLPDTNVLVPNVHAKVMYTKPCKGCSKCFSTRADLNAPAPQVTRRWWSSFMKPTSVQTDKDYSLIENPDCSLLNEEIIKTSDLRISPLSSRENEEDPPKLFLNIGPEKRYSSELLKDGLKYLKGLPIDSEKHIEMKEIEIHPIFEDRIDVISLEDSSRDNYVKEESTLYSSPQILIDNEEFDIRPVRITVLPKSLNIFYNNQRKGYSVHNK